MKDDYGIWIENQQDIATKLVADYSNQFKSNQNDRWNESNLQLKQLITNVDNEALVKIPNKEEVKQDHFAINSNKTPGPDGFGAGFCKHY